MTITDYRPADGLGQNARELDEYLHEHHRDVWCEIQSMEFHQVRVHLNEFTGLGSVSV